MELRKLSSEDVKKETIRLAEKIEREYKPDLIIFVSKGAYSIGMYLSEYFNVPLFEIFAERKTGAIKKIISPILRILPAKLKLFLRKKEIDLGIQVKNTERNTHWGYIPVEYKNFEFSNIILVDDSCDTGNTFIQCIRKIHEKFPNAQIKTAALNVFTMSKTLVNTDFYLYNDCSLSAPWSKDSKENVLFEKEYRRIFNRRG